MMPFCQFKDCKTYNEAQTKVPAPYAEWFCEKHRGASEWEDCTSIRGKLLSQAKALTEGDRNATYGDPKQNMVTIGEMMNSFKVATGLSSQWHELDAGTQLAINAAVNSCFIKLARIAVSPRHMDNYTDLIAYAAIAGECAERAGGH